jgi:pantoate--beta-alanine ligase
MQVSENIKETRDLIKKIKSKGKKIGFVPTMGALHNGHLELMKRSIKENDFTAISIFVNPIQFVQGEDFDKYPRPIEKDIEMAKSIGVDLVFTPNKNDITGDDLFTFIDIIKLQDNLDGLSRPGHFRGVCTIVAKLFNIILPDKAYFGKKDIQQLFIIKKMTEDLNFDIEIIPCEIVREKDGLAMSSRNVYLTETERKDAVVLYNSLKEANELIKKGLSDSQKIINKIKENIIKIDYAKIDYIKIVNTNMQDVNKIEKNDIIALAVFFGKARLIDNNIVGESL